MANGKKFKTVPQLGAGRAVPLGNIAAHADELAAHLLLRAEIRKRAYEMSCEQSCVPGRELDDWLKAEAEVRARHGIANLERSPALGGQRNASHIGMQA